MSENFGQVALGIATSSFNKVRDWLTTDVGPDKDIQLQSRSEQNTPDSNFGRKFSQFRQSLNYKQRHLTVLRANINEAISTSVSASQILERLATSPVLRRARTCGGRSQSMRKMAEFYSERSRSGSALASTELKSFQSGGSNSSFHADRLDDAEEIKHKVVENMESAITKTSYSTSEKSRHVREVRRESAVKMIARDNQNYGRQDSGSSSVADSNTPTENIHASFDEEETDEDVVDDYEDYKRIRCNTDPYKMIKDILNIEEAKRHSVYDPYRVTRRPSAKTNSSRLSGTLTLNDKRLLGRPQKDENTGMAENTSPRVKLSIQNFTSSKQIRIVVMEISNAHVSQNHGRSELYLTVCLKMGKRHLKTSRKIRSFSPNTVNEVIYFFDIDFDKLQDVQLRIRLYKHQRVWLMKKIVGEASVSMENFDFSFETAMWCTLRNKQGKDRNKDTTLEIV